MVMQFPSYVDFRAEMYDVIRAIVYVFISNSLEEQLDIFYVTIGKNSEHIHFDTTLKILKVTGKYIPRIYRKVLNKC